MTLVDRTDFRVVLFSGGRGSGALAELVGADPRVVLTVAVNGYDDGASTGEVRRFLGDALGPSDFRKNASRFARLRKTCAPALVDLLDRRLPEQATVADLRRVGDELDSAVPCPATVGLGAATREAVVSRLRRFDSEYRRTGRLVDFREASVGNFVFAGGFLACGRQFNDAVDDYCSLVGLPVGLIENVTDGANAFLVAIDDDDRLLGSEEEIVDARGRNRVREIYLVDRPFGVDTRPVLAAGREGGWRRVLDERSVRPGLNPRLAARLADADLIIYAPGTQHSSLLPSYLTPGLGDAIAANVDAIKLLVTNIQEDAEIVGRSAVDLIDRAVYYLREKDLLSTPTPCLITHYLINDPASTATDIPYVPLGRLESLEDPRLVRVGNYEAGTSGRHDAAKVLAPYIDSFVARRESVQRVAAVLTNTQLPNKLVQTMLEMVRGGIRNHRVDLVVFHGGTTDLDRALLERLPFEVRRLMSAGEAGQDRELRHALADGDFDYLILFDSSGMYNGEDIANLASHLTLSRLDAVWGSRRLSLRDIKESYRLRYRNKAIQGLISAVGSHALSLQFLMLYGRYVADTLSGARAIRVSDALSARCPLTHSLANHHFLSTLLRRRAEILEIPVQFFGISPDQVHRTTVAEGLGALVIAVRERLRRGP